MSYGVTPQLIVAALAVFVVGLVISGRVISLPTAIVVSAAKAMFPMLYFAYVFDGSWTFMDDWGYFEHGQVLMQSTYNPFSLLVHADALLSLFVLAGGHHVLYDWYNFLAQWLLGSFYFAPVFFNVALTFGIAYMAYRMALLSECTKRYSQGLFVFLLLHWELLAWSSLVNLKDTLVLFLTVAFVYTGMLFIETRRKRYLVGIVGLAFLFYWIRFYVPLILFLSAFAYFFHSVPMRFKLWSTILIGGLIAAYGSYAGWNELLGAAGTLGVGSRIVLGSVKMALSPQPWSIDPEYSFLVLPSLLHWLLFFPTAIGCIMLWHNVPRARALIVYLITALIVYGAGLDELQGPRHRVQLIFIYAWAQFHFVWYLLPRTARKSSGLRYPALSPEISRAK
jgi:hypothetical protein